MVLNHHHQSVSIKSRIQTKPDTVGGIIPAQFQAGVEVDDTMIFFETNEGDNGPEFRLAYVHPENVSR